LDIGIPIEEPQKFVYDGFEVEFFGGKHWKTFTEVKAHLITKTADGTRSRPIRFLGAFV